MFIETSSKAGYNVKQVCDSKTAVMIVLLLVAIENVGALLFRVYLRFQLFRRIANALPGVDNEKPSDARTFSCIIYQAATVKVNCAFCRASCRHRADQAATNRDGRRLMLVLSM